MALLQNLFYNLLIIGYFIWLQPPLLERLAAIPEQNDIPLGIALIAIQVAEMAGVWLKYPGIILHLREERQQSASGAFLTAALSLMHIFISAMLAITTIWALGIDLNGNPPLLPALAALVFFLLVLTKEGLVLNLAFIFLGRETKALKRNYSSRELTLRGAFGDLLLVGFSVMAYSVVWEKTIANTPLTGETWWQKSVEFFGVALFFFMVFPATRAIYYAEEWNTRQSKLQRIISPVFYLTAMLAAYIAIPKSSF